MKITTEALVIRENSIGDNDRLVTLMTRDMGVINAFAVGAKSIKSRRGAATALLSYSEFTLDKKKDSYKITEAEVKRVFFDAGSDIETLSLATYFCELSYFLCPHDDSCGDFLRLVLNSLYFITEKEKPLNLIKAITEFKIAAISGYEPNLISCSDCGKYEENVMYFSFTDGCIFCEKCKRNDALIPVNIDLLKAMRHIIYSDFEKIYSFTLSNDNINALSSITEKYLIYQTERNYKTLDFYKSIISGV